MRIARTAVVAVAGLGLCAAAVALGRGEREEVPVASETFAAITPKSVELRRCKALEEAALADPDCRRVWTEQRRRFLGLAPADEGVR